VLVEVSDRQVAVAAGIFRAAGLSARIASDEDLAATVVIATRA